MIEEYIYGNYNKDNYSELLFDFFGVEIYVWYWVYEVMVFIEGFVIILLNKYDVFNFILIKCLVVLRFIVYIFILIFEFWDLKIG